MYAVTDSLEISGFFLFYFFSSFDYFETIYHSIAMMMECGAMCNWLATHSV